MICKHRRDSLDEEQPAKEKNLLIEHMSRDKGYCCPTNLNVCIPCNHSDSQEISKIERWVLMIGSYGHITETSKNP